MININHFNTAIDMLTTLRDDALASELDIRADDPLASFADALDIIFEMNESIAPDTLDAIRALLDTIDPA